MCKRWHHRFFHLIKNKESFSTVLLKNLIFTGIKGSFSADFRHWKLLSSFGYFCLGSSFQNFTVFTILSHTSINLSATILFSAHMWEQNCDGKSSLSDIFHNQLVFGKIFCILHILSTPCISSMLGPCLMWSTNVPISNYAFLFWSFLHSPTTSKKQNITLATYRTSH